MAVPSSNNHLKNTTGGAFVAQTQGGTVLGNGTAGSVITNPLLVKDAVDSDSRIPFPVALDNNLYGTQTAKGSGTFAYMEAGKYVIKTVSDTINGVASTKVLSPAADGGRRAIHDFQHDFGAKLLGMWRASQFSWTGRLASGAAIPARQNWINAGATAPEVPATLSTTNMYDMTDTDAADKAVDVAATPTLAIPGKLVMKVDFVDVALATGGDYYNYKPITG